MSNPNEFHDDDYEIKEERGWLPQWWMILFYGTVAFSLVFAVYLHGVAGWSQEKQYADEVMAHEKRFPQVVAELTKDGVNPFRGDAAAIASGEREFMGLCATCHKADMTGLIGPSLVDREWLHGSTDREVFAVIMDGIPAEKLRQKPPKGVMPDNKNNLGAKKVLEVMAFLASKNQSLKAK